MLCAICVVTGKHVGIFSGGATGCNSVEQPLHYHGWLNTLILCLCGEQEHVLILVVVLIRLGFVREELRNAGVGITLSFMQVTILAWTFCSAQWPSYL